ncbi:hypothetical protein BD769DRAFT_1783496 [Suillus cothurnatus]|nr:hypothetical protein BD769DRAFT_1783496 [Suillus cothurnatus]
MHRLQPLDVSVFGPVQKAWMKRCEQYSVRTDDENTILQACNSTSTLDQLPLSFPTHLPSDWNIPSSKDPDFDPSAQQPTSCSNVKPLPDLDFDSESSTSKSADLELNPNINNDSDSNDSEMDIDKWQLSISEQPSFNSQKNDFRPPTPTDTNGSSSLHQQTGPVTRSLSGSRSMTQFSSISFSNHSWSSNYSTQIERYEEEIKCLHAKNKRVKAESEEMTWQCDSAVGHAVMLRQDYNTLKQRLNAKEDRQNRQGRGLQMHGLEDKEAAQQVQRNVMNDTVTYTGRLSSKSKPELEDIATTLLLSTKGTKSEILECIKEHLENTPNLCQDHRFSGLYSSRGNWAPQESDSHAGSSRIDHTAPIQAIPSQQLIPSISYGSMHTGAPFSSQVAQQMNSPPPFPSFNPPPAYPLHYPG